MSGLEQFGAYQKGLELFDLVVEVAAILQRDARCWKLVSQQVASADSIGAHMEEGYGRLSRAEYIRFLDFSRGSARETQGRYRRLKHWLPHETITQRVRLLDEIIGILTRTIQTLRRGEGRGSSAEGRVSGVK